RRDADGIRVWVHIADVSAYVRPGDVIDAEAYRRCTSVYLPGSVEPMLPPELSNDACSLVPGKERRAVTVEMLFDGPTVTKVAFARTLIRSDARLTYGQVDEIFAGRAQAAEPWAEPLALAREVGKALDGHRLERNALTVDTAESVFEFDKTGDVADSEQERQTESHRVVEHLMIAANEQVATYLEQQKLPALFRVHERPDPESVERLVEQLADLDVATPPMPDSFTSQEAEQLVGKISESVATHVKRVGHGQAGLTSLVLRSLKMAVYSPKNLGHSGLSSPRYCHFTSPIRRYPDLIVHRALLAGLGLDDCAPLERDLPEAATDTSTRERDAVKIERKADAICRAFLLDAMLKEELAGRGSKRVAVDEDGEVMHGVFDGEVTGMVASGVFVAFGDQLQFEGFVRGRDLRELLGGYWKMNEFATAMEDDESGRRLTVGQSLIVQVERVDTARARVDLLPLKV
ncbi:MAG: RNB domain-containing ribonuclease, partial [Thermoleophilaceae bacterium]|nr:RNB domain-containing ribonuclease [Thermoleophilaceae bacterium]